VICYYCTCVNVWRICLCVGHTRVKDKVFPYSLLSVRTWADPGVQAVSPQVTLSHPPSIHYLPSSLRLPLYFHQIAPIIYTVANICFQLTTYLSTPQQWSPISWKSSMGLGKFASQRPTFYCCATQLTMGTCAKMAEPVNVLFEGRPKELCVRWGYISASWQI